MYSVTEIEKRIEELRVEATRIAERKKVPLAVDGHPGDRRWRFSNNYNGDLTERLLQIKIRRQANGNGHV